MILAAGRGQRLRPFTDQHPKPLIPIAGKPLIQHLLEKLAQHNINEVIINQGWLGEQLPEQLGNGANFGLKIYYSYEGWPSLDTGGGIYQALPYFQNQAFLLINGDVWSEHNFNSLPSDLGDKAAHLLMVKNPKHNPKGDFGLKHGLLSPKIEPKLTYSGIGIYHPRLFNNTSAGRFPLAPLLKQAMLQQQISGELSLDYWQDVGTAKRLQQLEKHHAKTTDKF